MEVVTAKGTVIDFDITRKVVTLPGYGQVAAGRPRPDHRLPVRVSGRWTLVDLTAASSEALAAAIDRLGAEAFAASRTPADAAFDSLMRLRDAVDTAREHGGVQAQIRASATYTEAVRQWHLEFPADAALRGPQS